MSLKDIQINSYKSRSEPKAVFSLFVRYFDLPIAASDIDTTEIFRSSKGIEDIINSR